MSFKEQADIINDNFAYLMSAKQNKISDLSDIREGAEKGATAVQPGDNVSELTNDAKYQKDTEVAASISTHNSSTSAHSDIRTAINTEKTRATGAESTLQTNINTEKTRATGVESGLRTDVDTINGKIPSQASTTNQLADKSFVNSSIATETANFVGTFNTLAELQAVPNPTNNDYGFVKTTDATGNTVYNRYKYVASVPEWKFEYALNNSAFTATQWSAINSGATSELIGKITTNETAISDHVGNTSNPHSVTKAQVGLGNVDNTSDADKPVSTAQQTALDLKQDKSTAVTHTASTAVGSATKPVYVKTDGTVAEITSYEGTSAKATADASGNVITTTYATKTEMGNKQDKSTAVTHTASTAVGSATKPVYINASGVATAITSYEGTSAKATADASGNVITATYATKTEVGAKQDKLTAGSNIQISDTNVISATDTTYTAGTGIKIENNVISNTQTSAEWGKITGTLSSQTDLQTALNGKQATISDLETIRSGAEAGATAVQPGANVSTLTNDAGYIDKTVGDLTKYTTTTNLMIELGKKQNTISDLSTIRSGAEAGATAYQKPSTGIPKSDLASAVQTSLGKADTALQSITSSDVTTALGYTPYSSTNPNGYQTASQVSTAVSGKQDKLTAGTGITITNNTISATATAPAWGDITGTLSSQTDLKNALDGKYDASNPNGYTSNVGTITGIKMNGASKGTSGEVDLGTVITSTADCVKTSGNQTIAGTKTFSSTITGSISGNAATATKATQDASGNVITSTYETKANVTSAISTHNTSVDAHEDIREKIKDIELFKFPNAIIIGSPTINNGQVSNFSAANYMQFPFIVDVRSKNFQIDFSFTTGSNVTTQQNIIDSKFGLALAIANGKGLMAISTTGTNWDLGSVVGTISMAANTTYYAKLSWDGATYKTALSTDGITYTDDMSVASTVGPYPRTMYIGGGNATELGRTANPFGGIINMNKAYLTIAGIVIWQGMDDAGLATRADVSLSNLDAAGQAKFTAKQDKLTAGTGIKIENNVISNTQTSAEWGNITGTLSSQTDLKNALDAKQDNLTVGSGITITNNTVSNDLVTDTDDVFITLHDADPSSPEYDPDNLYPGKEDVANKVTVVDSTSTDVTYPTSKAVYTELNKKANDSAVVHLTGNETIAGTKTFSSAISGSITGNAATATKATQDSAGQQINTTYIKALSVSGTTITYTKGNGTTGTITTQDTNNKVQSVVSTANTNYPILLNNGTAATTNTTLIDTGIYANPSTNTLGADKVGLANKVTMQYNSTTEALEFVFA